MLRPVVSGSMRASIFKVRRFLGLGLVAVLIALPFTALRAEDPAAIDAPDSPERLAAQIDAGEFAPALRAATALPRGAKRDEVLAQMAGAQVRAGASRNAYLTASQVDDDSLR